MRTKRYLLIVVLIFLSLLVASCTDEVVIKSFPAACIGKKTKQADTRVKAELRIVQPGSLGEGAGHSVLINEKGEAHFTIGGRNQEQRLFQSGHAPVPRTAKDRNTIYTGDPVTITLTPSQPCTVGTKAMTVVLDDFPHLKHFGDGYTYVLPLDKFN